MADKITTVYAWRTTRDVNSPLDSSDINPSNPNVLEYASLGNALRDIKGALREESLNLGWDSSSSWANNIVNTDGTITRYVAAVDNEKNKILLSTWYGKWTRGVEGQQFILSVGQQPANSTNAQSYNYYTGYVASTRANYNVGRTESSGSYVYLTGMRKWERPSSGSDHSGLQPIAVDGITDADYALIGNGVIDPTSAAVAVDVFMDFSAYAPMQNLGYSSTAYRYPNTGNDGETSLDSNPNSVQPCPVPRRSQCGTMRTINVALQEKREVCAVFPYPEIDTNYSISITPTAGLGSSAVGAYTVEKVIKSKSFCVVRMLAANTTGIGNYTEFDWEIRRNY